MVRRDLEVTFDMKCKANLVWRKYSAEHLDGIIFQRWNKNRPKDIFDTQNKVSEILLQGKQKVLQMKGVQL